VKNRLHGALARAASDLARLRAPFALVGGVAVSVRAEPRLTRDLDLAVAVARDAEAEALVRSLVADGYGTTSLVEQEHAGRLATVRLVAPGEAPKGVVIDLLFASSGIEPEIIAGAEPLEIFSGLTVPVARVGHLVALKLLARDDRHRPQDAADLRALRMVASDEEIARARAAADLIQQRGFARGRNLQRAVDDWVTASPT
jgi:predicted nucleotidyltransferase